MSVGLKHANFDSESQTNSTQIKVMTAFWECLFECCLPAARATDRMTNSRDRIRTHLIKQLQFDVHCQPQLNSLHAAMACLLISSSSFSPRWTPVKLRQNSLQRKISTSTPSGSGCHSFSLQQSNCRRATSLLQFLSHHQLDTQSQPINITCDQTMTHIT